MYQLRIGNATDAGASPYCIDCGNCDVGDVVKVVKCATNFSQDTRSQQFRMPFEVETNGRWWMTIVANRSGNCLQAFADGRQELTLAPCTTSVLGQHWSEVPMSSVGTRLDGINHLITNRQFQDRHLSGAYLDTSGCSGGYLLWPKPGWIDVPSTSVEVGVDAGFRFVPSPGSSSGLLERAIQRYGQLVFGNATTPEGLPIVSQLIITCTGKPTDCADTAVLGEDSDEWYRIFVQLPTEGPATLEARSVWGLLRGLETFSQMVERRPTTVGGSTERYLRAVPVRVTDAPRWSYRGLMVDTARHYLPLSLLQQHIDAMSWSKMNVFHWHPYDGGHFSFVSKSIPNLANAAVAPGWQYSHDEILGLVKYARDRGVRVIVEFDVPGHSNSLYKAIPEMGSTCYQDYLQDMPFQGPMNPCLNKTWDTLNKLLSEFAPLFLDSRIHLGGDEVAYNCWSEDPRVQLGCRGGAQNESFSDLETRFYAALDSILKPLNKKSMHWHDPLTERNVKLHNNTLIEVWDGTSPDVLADVLTKGFETVYAGSYYLDHLDQYWDDFYSVDPAMWSQIRSLPATSKARLKGIEACIWSETVDRTDAITKTWPRAAAIAERAWSSANATLPIDWSPSNKGALSSGYKRGPGTAPWIPESASGGHQFPTGVLLRMHAHRCRLLERGIGAAPAFFGLFASNNWIFDRGGICPQDGTRPA